MAKKTGRSAARNLSRSDRADAADETRPNRNLSRPTVPSRVPSQSRPRATPSIHRDRMTISFTDQASLREPNRRPRSDRPNIEPSMLTEIGLVEAIFRYPVKSMGGERLDVADLGWHGLDGDRRLAFRRIDDRSGFPWLSAGKLPDLLLFSPHRREHGAQGDLPTHIRT